MTKAAAIYKFWSGFGLNAYEQSSVPTGTDAPKFPYITYSFASDSFGEQLATDASVWYRSTSWTDANKKSEEISKKIGRGGVFLPCDDGAVWIKRGTPFSQSMSDENDNMIRRKYINVSLEFVTAY